MDINSFSELNTQLSERLANFKTLIDGGQDGEASNLLAKINELLSNLEDLDASAYANMRLDGWSRFANSAMLASKREKESRYDSAWRHWGEVAMVADEELSSPPNTEWANRHKEICLQNLREKLEQYNEAITRVLSKPSPEVSELFEALHMAMDGKRTQEEVPLLVGMPDWADLVKRLESSLPQQDDKVPLTLQKEFDWDMKQCGSLWDQAIHSLNESLLRQAYEHVSKLLNKYTNNFEFLKQLQQIRVEVEKDFDNLAFYKTTKQQALRALRQGNLEEADALLDALKERIPESLLQRVDNYLMRIHNSIKTSIPQWKQANELEVQGRYMEAQQIYGELVTRFSPPYNTPFRIKHAKYDLESMTRLTGERTQPTYVGLYRVFCRMHELGDEARHSQELRQIWQTFVTLRAEFIRRQLVDAKSAAKYNMGEAIVMVKECFNLYYKDEENLTDYRELTRDLTELTQCQRSAELCMTDGLESLRDWDTDRAKHNFDHAIQLDPGITIAQKALQFLRDLDNAKELLANNPKDIKGLKTLRANLAKATDEVGLKAYLAGNDAYRRVLKQVDESLILATKRRFRRTMLAMGTGIALAIIGFWLAFVRPLMPASIGPTVSAPQVLPLPTSQSLAVVKYVILTKANGEQFIRVVTSDGKSYFDLPSELAVAYLGNKDRLGWFTKEYTWLDMSNFQFEHGRLGIDINSRATYIELSK